MPTKDQNNELEAAAKVVYDDLQAALKTTKGNIMLPDQLMKAPAQKPSIGRVVHYQAYGTPGGEYQSKPRAAIITDVLEGAQDVFEQRVSLCILNPTGLFFPTNVPYSETPKPGCWSWPPRT